MWAKTLCPFSSSTRNIAFGRGSTTVPSTSMTSSFGTLPLFPSNGFSPSGRTCEHGLQKGRSNSIRATVEKCLRGLCCKPYRLALQHRQDLRPVLGDGDRVLEVSRQRPVGGHHGPPVGEDAVLLAPEREHGLHRDREAGPELQTSSRGSQILDERLLVHAPADPVPAVL